LERRGIRAARAAGDRTDRAPAAPAHSGRRHRVLLARAAGRAVAASRNSGGAARTPAAAYARADPPLVVAFGSGVGAAHRCTRCIQGGACARGPAPHWPRPGRSLAGVPSRAVAPGSGAAAGVGAGTGCVVPAHSRTGRANVFRPDPRRGAPALAAIPAWAAHLDLARL